jgi:hypothetical protein
MLNNRNKKTLNSLASISACFITVSVASSCISGGYPYSLSVLLMDIVEERAFVVPFDLIAGDFGFFH